MNAFQYRASPYERTLTRRCAMSPLTFTIESSHSRRGLVALNPLGIRPRLRYLPHRPRGWRPASRVSEGGGTDKE